MAGNSRGGVVQEVTRPSAVAEDLKGVPGFGVSAESKGISGTTGGLHGSHGVCREFSRQKTGVRG